jgi:integrase
MAESPLKRRRAPHTVKGYMKSVMAAIRWAHLQEWIESMPRIRLIKTTKLKHMKGRPLVAEEFERMLAETVLVTGEHAAASWRYALRGLWQSALRLDELMHVSWDIPGTIQPAWRPGRLPVLRIPAEMQKNATEEEIPLLPWFDSLLLETPEHLRTQWIFNPLSLQLRVGRRARIARPDSEWVGRIISRVGKAAGVIVEQGNSSGKPIKYASAHDLRRSCAERLLDAGVPPMTIARVLRHSSWETTRRHYAPGDVQKDAGILQSLLTA